MTLLMQRAVGLLNYHLVTLTSSCVCLQLINQKIRMCKQLLDCSSFVSVLQFVLAIGNYLNENAGKEKAKGFRLSSLTKVRLRRRLTFDLRSSRSFRLISYVCSTVFDPSAAAESKLCVQLQSDA